MFGFKEVRLGQLEENFLNLIRALNFGLKEAETLCKMYNDKVSAPKLKNLSVNLNRFGNVEIDADVKADGCDGTPFIYSQTYNIDSFRLEIMEEILTEKENNNGDT